LTSISLETHGNSAVITFDRPPVNALDVDTLHDLADTLDRVAGDDPDGVILTGRGNVFSAGADLRRVLEADADYIAQGIEALTRAFETLFVFPRPVVAAVNGYALAGGAVLTCECDHRLMGESAGEIGAIELAAGVPFPSWALEIMRFAVNNEHLQEVILFGRSYPPPVAMDKGLIDEIVPDAELMERALAIVDELARVPRTTFAISKRELRHATVVAARDGSERFDDEVKAAWASEEVLSAVKRQMERLSSS
jgi:enoyl-CoA hydratase